MTATLTYSLKDLAAVAGKSPALLYRRLTEQPRRYVVRFARREGGTWVFNQQLVDEAIQKGEALIIRTGPERAPDFALARALNYFSSGPVPCTEGKPCKV